MESVLDQVTLTGPSLTATRRYQVAVENLQLEMFVVELDRPWLDTPFLLQGFLIDSKVELDTLVKYCDYVYIDLDLSSPALANIIRRVEIRASELALERFPRKGAEPSGSGNAAASRKAVQGPAATSANEMPASVPGANAVPGAAAAVDVAAEMVSTSRSGPRREYRPRADVKISQLTRQRFRNFVRQNTDTRTQHGESFIGRWFGRLVNLLERKPGADDSKSPPAATEDLLPQGIKSAQYEERRAMIEELPRARFAFSGGEAAMADLVVAIRSGKVLQLEPVEQAVGSIVQSMQDNPDALMWVARLREEDVNTYNHGVRVALYLVALDATSGCRSRN